MLYSKANLKVAAVASSNQYDGALAGVQFDEDGGTAACDGNGLLAVGPTRAETHFPDVGPRATPGAQGVVLKPDFVQEVESIIPRDKRISLQHVAMTVGRDPAKTEFTTVDKTGRVRRVAEWPKRDKFPDWRGVVRKALDRKNGEEPTRVCVGRKTLLNVLRALVEACPEAGDAPVYLEIGSGVVMRAASRETGQHVVGVAAAFNTGDRWLERDEWERGIIESKKPERSLKPERKV
jgi:hypothetical protein